MKSPVNIFNKQELFDCNDTYPSIGNKKDLVFYFTFFEVGTLDFDADLFNGCQSKNNKANE